MAQRTQNKTYFLQCFAGFLVKYIEDSIKFYGVSLGVKSQLQKRK